MYGNTIRFIRTVKNLQMKYVYQGICSKTNAIKFEKGERMLKADKFQLLLNHLMISMEEFLWIYNGNKPNDLDYVKYNLLKKQSSSEDYQLIDTNNSLGKMDRAQAASLNLIMEYRNQKEFSQNYINILMDYFANLEFWTLEDLKLFSNNCYFLPYDSLLHFLDEDLKVISRYEFFKLYDLILANMLANCIDIMIKNNDIKNAQTFNKQLHDISVGVTLNGYRIISEYYRAKIDFLFLNYENGLSMLELLLPVAKLIDNQELSNEINELLNI